VPDALFWFSMALRRIESYDEFDMGVTERIILFDGVCNLCNGLVQFVLARDGAGKFRFASLQSAAAVRLLGSDGPVETIVLIEAGKTYIKSAAALRIARGLRFPWPILFGQVVVPGPLRDWIYDWVARNRYRWFGKRDACMLPTPQMRGRFLE
jgi:predicted DCC family thiol-disulfide oxidoreductase YuxK